MKKSFLALSVLFVGSCRNIELNHALKLVVSDFEQLSDEQKELFNSIKENLDGRKIDDYAAFLVRIAGAELGKRETINNSGDLVRVFESLYPSQKDLKTFVRICRLDDLVAFKLRIFKGDEKERLQNLLLSYENGVLSDSHNAQVYKSILSERAENILNFLVKQEFIPVILNSETVIASVQAEEELARKEASVNGILIENPLAMMVELGGARNLVLRKAASGGAGPGREERLRVAREMEEQKYERMVKKLQSVPNILLYPSKLYAGETSRYYGFKVTVKEEKAAVSEIAASVTPRKAKAISKLAGGEQLPDELYSTLNEMNAELGRICNKMGELTRKMQDMLISERVLDIRKHFGKREVGSDDHDYLLPLLKGSMILKNEEDGQEVEITDKWEIIKRFAGFYNSWNWLEKSFEDLNGQIADKRKLARGL